MQEDNALNPAINPALGTATDGAPAVGTPQQAPEDTQSLMTKRDPEPVQEAPAALPEVQQQEDKDKGDAPEETPDNLVDMIGTELMQDPASSIAAKALQGLVGDIDVKRAFGAAYEYDDPTRIDRAYLVEKLGDRADEALEIATYLFDHANTVAERMQKEFFDSVDGGQAGLEQAAAIFGSTAEPATQKMVADMLDSGNMQYMQYAARIIQEHAARSGGQYKHRGLVAAQASSQAPMSRTEYVAAIQNPNLTEQEYNSLRARFAASARR